MESFVWDIFDSEKKLRCSRCQNSLMAVIHQPVARKVHKRHAHRVRVIAKCPLCGESRRIALGSSR
jgi:uncharacterized protein with PIN domain